MPEKDQRYTHAALKARQRQIRDGFPPALSLRVHRALSWYGRAEQESGDDDARFVFLWIAFNAAYAQEISQRPSPSEKATFIEFLGRLLRIDQEQQIYGLLWSKYPSSIRLLLENPYVFQPFWDYQAGLPDSANWEDRFSRSKAQALKALANKDSLRVLQMVLDRLYVLRNQVFHGGSTWNSSINRNQLRDATHFMSDLVPRLISMMMDSPEESWEMPSYPVAKPNN